MFSQPITLSLALALALVFSPTLSSASDPSNDTPHSKCLDYVFHDQFLPVLRNSVRAPNKPTLAGELPSIRERLIQNNGKSLPPYPEVEGMIRGLDVELRFQLSREINKQTMERFIGRLEIASNASSYTLYTSIPALNYAARHSYGIGDVNYQFGPFENLSVTLDIDINKDRPDLVAKIKNIPQGVPVEVQGEFYVQQLLMCPNETKPTLEGSISLENISLINSK